MTMMTMMTTTEQSRTVRANSLPHPPATRLEQDLESHIPSDWFSKDGKGTIFLEGIPGVGYVVAAAQVTQGNTVSTRP